MQITRRGMLLTLGAAVVPLACRKRRRLRSVEGALATTNSIGRAGAYYLPGGYAGATLPMLVAIHGTGGSGSVMVAAFRALADERRFLVVAPDSRRSPAGEFTWEVGTRPGEVSEDYRHALACADEVGAMPSVSVDRGRVLIAGFSGGASMAPYLATNDDRFGAFAVLHGGVFPGGLGAHAARGWISTGESDSIRTAEAQRRHESDLRAAGLDVTARTFPGGHGLGEAELRGLVDWWLAG